MTRVADESRCWFSIYGLCNERGTVIYVGSTRQELAKRLHGHVAKPGRFAHLDPPPTIKRLARVRGRKAAREAERYWMGRFKRLQNRAAPAHTRPLPTNKVTLRVGLELKDYEKLRRAAMHVNMTHVELARRAVLVALGREV